MSNGLIGGGRPGKLGVSFEFFPPKSDEAEAQLWRSVKALEEAGAFGAEIEVVPADVTAEIGRRTSLFLVSMGGGTGGDCC